MTDRDRAIDDVISKQEINDVLVKYARGVDRGDLELLKSCYHPDAIEEHGPNFTGLASDYFEGAIDRIRAMGTMCHYLCNVHIELEGDKAYVETYVLTFVRLEKDGTDIDTFTGGRLCDKFERRDNAWKISDRKIVFDWNRDVEASETWCLGMFDPADPKMNIGQKNQRDLSYQRF